MDDHTADSSGQGPRISVAPDDTAYGVYGLGYPRKSFIEKKIPPPYSYDWREPPGSLANTGGVRPVYVPTPLHAALTRVYDTDAHAVQYVLHDYDGKPLARQPRLNKHALPWLREEGYTLRFECMLVDIDNPKGPDGKKLPWDADLMSEWLDRWRELDSLRGFGGYYTRGGLRIIVPLSRPVSEFEFEEVAKAYLRWLERDGMHPDWKCTDWTRHLRLPNVERRDKDTGVLTRLRSPVTESEGTYDIAEGTASARAMDDEREGIAARRAVGKGVGAGAGKRRAKGERRGTQGERATPAGFVPEAPAAWEERIEILGAGIRAEEFDAFHHVALSIAGAMCRRGVDLATIPAVVASAIMAGGGLNYADAEAPARDTVQRYCGGIEVTGMRHLYKTYPQIASALDEVMARGREAQLRAQAKVEAAKPQLTADEASAKQADVIRHARDGVTLLSSAPGIGKSHSARRVAAERSVAGLVDLEADVPEETIRAPASSRAPRGSKTGITTITHALSKEYYADLSDGYSVPTKRTFSPASLLDADGAPVCRYQQAAQKLVGGGLPMQHELCDGRGKTPCEYRKGCAAYPGFEGDDPARATVGPHAYLGRVIDDIGASGLLVIDEPPALVMNECVTRDEVDRALKFTGIGKRYLAAMRPALLAIAWYMESSDLTGEMVGLGQVITDGIDGVPPADLRAALAAAQRDATDSPAHDAVECARAAHKPDARHTAPPFGPVEIGRAKANAAHADLVGAVARVYTAVYKALTGEYSPGVWLENKDGRRQLAMKFTDERVVEALRRDGATVVMDANMEIHREVYRKLIGAEPYEYAFTAADGAPIARTLMRTPRANRTGWFKRGMPEWEGGVKRGLARVIAWLRRDPATTRAGLITFRPVALAIDCIRNLEPAAAERAWARAKFPPEELAAARAVLGPVLADWPGLLMVGHYGAVRGLNSFQAADLDALATLGDPWPDMGDVQRECEYLGLEENPSDRAEAMCRADLTQAHGRIREPRRARPARLLHLGNVLPGGLGWMAGNVAFENDPGGPTRDASTLTAAAFAEILAMHEFTHARAAKVCSCTEAMIRAYITGQKPIPRTVADNIRKLC